jgi:hypothetical protein
VIASDPNPITVVKHDNATAGTDNRNCRVSATRDRVPFHAAAA